MPAVVVGVGEILWDLFPSGPRFGGAPANFACHAAALGADVRMFGAVGDDELGRAAVEALGARGVRTGHVSVDPEKPTGTVAVSVDPAGVARYEFAADAAWDRMPWREGLAALAAEADAVCYGTLGQRDARSRATIRRFVAATRPECLRIFDVNLRPPFYDADLIRDSLRIANVLKLNDEELPKVASLLGISGTEAGIVEDLLRGYGLSLVALTRGPGGAAFFRGGLRYECAGREVEVVDTVGAGDAFTAAAAIGLLRGDDPRSVLERAVEVATYVCTQPGATPDLPDRLRLPPGR